MHKGSENLILVQVATLLSAQTARSDHQHSNTVMLPIAGKIVDLVGRHCAGLSEGAKVLLSFQCANIIADHMLANHGELCLVNLGLLRIAAGDLSLIDSHTCVQWQPRRALRRAA